MSGKIYRAWTDDGQSFLIGEAGLEAYGPDILKPPHLVTLPPRPEPEPLTDDELDALEALTNAATPGPWEWSDYDHDLHAVTAPAFGYAETDPAAPWTMESIIITDSGCYPPEKDDAAFIAASRTAVPALIAEVRRLRAALIEERAYHIAFENLSVLSWRDMPQDQIAMLREAAGASLHVSTAELHDWLYDPDR